MANNTTQNPEASKPDVNKQKRIEELITKIKIQNPSNKEIQKWKFKGETASNKLNVALAVKAYIEKNGQKNKDGSWQVGNVKVSAEEYNCLTSFSSNNSEQR